MLRIRCEPWITLSRLIHDWANELADGTTEVNLWNDVCRAFNAGFFDHAVVVLLDKVNGLVLSPTDSQLWRHVYSLGDRIFLSKKTAHDLALWCDRSPPSCCADAVKGVTQPGRLPGQTPPAPEAMIIGEIRFAYHHAEITGEKPPNIKEVSRAVQLALEQKGYRASRRQIEKLAEADDFKILRWPPGKRRRRQLSSLLTNDRSGNLEAPTSPSSS
jgi:hypothetical protein